MSFGFQTGAFQQSAFQQPALTPRNAFQRGAFQNGAFQSPSTASVGGFYAGAKRKRFIVKHDGKLLVFATRQEASEALEALQSREVEAPAEAAEKPRKKSKRKAAQTQDSPAVTLPVVLPDRPQIAPLQSIDIGYIEALARQRGLQDMAARLMAQARWRALIDLVEQMQDEEDVELLLMTVH